MYMYIYMCMCVCVCVYVFMYLCIQVIIHIQLSHRFRSKLHPGQHFIITIIVRTTLHVKYYSVLVAAELLVPQEAAKYLQVCTHTHGGVRVTRH